jgi:methyl-accepting chemotaxis protein
LFIIVNVNSYQNIQDIKDNEKWVNHTNKVLIKILNIDTDLKDAETGKRGYIITGQESYLKTYNNAVSSVYRNIEELKRLTRDNSSQQEKISQLIPKVDFNLAEMNKLIELREDVGFQAAQEVLVTGVHRDMMSAIRVLLTAMENEENRLLQERIVATEKSTKNAINTMLWSSIGAAMVVLLLIIYFIRNIANPIKNLSKHAIDISQGKINRIGRETRRADEIGILLNAFKSMQKYLKQRANEANYIAEGNLAIEVKPVSEEDIMGIAFSTMIDRLRQQITEVSEGVKILSSSSSDIMASISQLSSTTSETSTSISETTSTIEEVKQTADVSNQRAKEISDSAQKLSDISHDGYQSIQDTIQGMNKIKSQMESIAGIVIQLSEKSLTIGEIATTVNDLTEQSNLLAVNASIEAAKAGEQGKGFSVVAQEIKHLAERSKESTIQIRSILADIQKEISSAVMATEEGEKVIGSALELSNNASEVITTLAASVEEASEANIQIAASSQQQLTGMDQITIAMESINEASRQVSSISKQTEASVAKLSDFGHNLQRIMDQYKLKK